MLFNVYIPKPDTHIANIISKGSAVIKAKPLTESLMLVYYEGNIFQASNVVTFSDKCRLAAGRATDSYPTTAMLVAREGDMTLVGRYDLEEHHFTLDEEKSTDFDAWCEA